MIKTFKVKLLKSYEIKQRLSEERLNFLKENECSLRSIINRDDREVIFHVSEFGESNKKSKDFYNVEYTYIEFSDENHPFRFYVPKEFVTKLSGRIEINFDD